ncbi:hypothetical protein HZH66_006693 [Vespula vulgaris]|uniref:Uncharacterized protein n=1 Tax=Vespula vulgaris TaxID=7454 RepID=A0A834K2C1_VESVU|nr:hypothetical protein HZH66_006693 [Vespula vulgaris]
MCKIDNNGYNESNHVYHVLQTTPGIVEVRKYSTKLAQFVAARSAKWKTLQGGRYAPAPKVKARTRAKPKVRKLPLVLSYSSKGNSEWNQRGNYPGVRKGVREGLLARALCARKPPAF